MTEHPSVLVPASWRRDEPIEAVLAAARSCPGVTWYISGQPPDGLEVPGNVVMLPTDRQLRAMRIVESVIAAKANTLVFADISGFHRRGEFSEGARREQIQIRFYDRPSAKKRR